MAQANARNFLGWLHRETRPAVLAPTLTMGVVTGSVEVLYALSLASMVFSGDLAPYLPYGIGISILSSVVLLICTSAVSAVPGVFSSTQDSSTVMLAVMVAALAASLRAGDEKIGTILVAISATTLLTGLLYLTLGQFKLGKLVRFIPYPVMGGFLAGTGWLLAQASLEVTTGLTLEPGNLLELFAPARLILWLPGLVLGFGFFFGFRRFSHFLTAPVMILGAVGLIYLALLVTGTSIQTATSRGLLLGQVVGHAVWEPLAFGQRILTANWGAVLGQVGSIAVVLMLSVIGFLLNVSALELTTPREIQLDRELKSVGIANVISGLLGGMIGYHMIADTTLNNRVGATGKLAGIVTGIVCLVTFLAGASILAYLPTAIIGALLFFLGMEFLVEWLVIGWKRLSRTDYAIVLMIWLVIATTNFLLGVAVGLVASVILFVVNYSRIDVVHRALTAAEMRSNVERSPRQQRLLVEQLGPEIRIFELQGFLFFGTANALLDQIVAHMTASGERSTRFIILDFRRVTGLDSSVGLTLARARQRAEAQGITLVLTHVSHAEWQQFERAGLFADGSAVGLFPDLDHGLEWCEDRLLEQQGVGEATHLMERLKRQLKRAMPSLQDTGRLTRYLEREDIQAGQYLMRRGDLPSEMYFVEAGMVDVQLESSDGRVARLRSFRGGSTVGEIGLYLGTPRTASVVAARPSVVYRLSAESLQRMRDEDPEAAALLHQWIAQLLAERLAAADRTIEALMN